MRWDGSAAILTRFVRMFRRLGGLGEEITVDIVAYIALAIHVICGIGMIVFVLLHSGKGTGVSSLFGAGMPASATGTGMIEKNLDRITIAFAAGYGLSALLLMVVYRPGV